MAMLDLDCHSGPHNLDKTAVFSFLSKPKAALERASTFILFFHLYLKLYSIQCAFCLFNHYKMKRLLILFSKIMHCGLCIDAKLMKCLIYQMVS